MEMDQYLYQASQQAMRPPPSNNSSDEWLDRLTLDGFPIREILASIFKRYQQDSAGFGKYITRRAASLTSCKYKVKNFLPRLPITMEVSEIIPLLMDKYRISADGAKLLLEDYLWIYQEEAEVFSELTRRGMTVIRQEVDRVYQSVFFCNDQMRSNFNRFGDVICVDFKPINIRNDSKRKGTMIGIFTGQDTNLHHTLFGVAIIYEDKESNYIMAVKQFLKAMRSNRFPCSFIVGDSQLLYSALCKLSQKNKENGRQSFTCLVGWHHLMDKISRLFKSHEQRNLIMQKFGNILSSLNKQQLKQKIKELMALTKNDESMQNFINEHQKYFVAANESAFIGFGIEKDNFSMLYKIMYNFLREAEGMGFVFQQILKMEEMLLSRIKKGYELLNEKDFQSLGLVLTDQLRYLSIRLQRKLYKKFLIMYRTAVKYAKLIAVSPDGLYYQIAFKSEKRLPYRTFVYTVHYCLLDNCWKCNCGFIYESGIPCAHLIKIIRRFRGSLAYYINKRWMIQNSRFNPEEINHPSELHMQPEKDDCEDEVIETSSIGEKKSKSYNYHADSEVEGKMEDQVKEDFEKVEAKQQ